MTFKVGDRVIDTEYGKGTIVETDSGLFYNSILVQFDNKNKMLHDGNQSKGTYEDKTCWHYSPISAENRLVKINSFTKSDLKDRDIITYKNGRKSIFINNKFIDLETNALIENNYTKDLKATVQEEFDIVKVERPVNYKTLFDYSLETKEMTVSEIEEKLGYPVKIIREEK